MIPVDLGIERGDLFFNGIEADLDGTDLRGNEVLDQLATFLDESHA
jgi:hypothetical protein